MEARSVDGARKAGTTWGSAENGYYLLSVWRGRIEFPELKRMLIAQAHEWNPTAILVSPAETDTM